MRWAVCATPQRKQAETFEMERPCCPAILTNFRPYDQQERGLCLQNIGDDEPERQDSQPRAKTHLWAKELPGLVSEKWREASNVGKKGENGRVSIGYLCACAATVVVADIERKRAAGGLVRTARIIFVSTAGGTSCHEKNFLKIHPTFCANYPAVFMV